MDQSKLNRGIPKGTSIEHLKGALDFEVILPLLGIDPVSYHGDWIQASCPDLHGFHDGGDASPSFGVNTEGLGYNCFVCGGGSLTELVAGILEVDEEAAVEWLEEHSTLQYVATKDDFESEIERNLARVYAEAVPETMPDYPPDLLFQYDKVHPYVWKRGLSREIVVEMQIGFSEEHVGIVIPHFFDQKLVGIQYRHLAQAKDKSYLCPDAFCNPPHKKKVPKYKNTPHFPRNTTLFNYDIASEYLTVIVVESPFTALYLMSHGYRNVVATFGAGLSGEQAWLLSRFTDGVYLWPDNDPAGSQWFVEMRKNSPSKRPAHGLVMLEKAVPAFIVPAAPGDKADPADVTPGEIDRYLGAAYPTTLYPQEGLKIGYANEKDN